MKNLWIFNLILFISLNLFSQNTDYKLIINQQGIQIFTREIKCYDNQNGIYQDFYALQFVNTTNKFIDLTWNIDYWMNGVCVTCNNPKTNENTYSLHLEPGQIFESNCDKNSLKGTRIYIREIYNTKSTVLSKFEIVNLQVNFKHN